MDWTTFKANTLEFVWRTGDDVLDAQLSDLVRTAENRLRVDLDWHETETSSAFTVGAYPAVDLPSDCDKVLALIWNTRGPGTYVTNREYYAAQPEQQWPAGSNPRPVSYSELEFTVIGKKVFHHFLNADTENVDATLIYEPLFSSLESGDDALYNAYEALYKAAVYYEVYKFLMNYDQAAFFDQEYRSRIDAGQIEQNRRKYAGAPLKMQMPRTDVS